MSGAGCHNAPEDDELLDEELEALEDELVRLDELDELEEELEVPELDVELPEAPTGSGLATGTLPIGVAPLSSPPHANNKKGTRHVRQTLTLFLITLALPQLFT